MMQNNTATERFITAASFVLENLEKEVAMTEIKSFDFSGLNSVQINFYDEEGEIQAVEAELNV